MNKENDGTFFASTDPKFPTKELTISLPSKSQVWMIGRLNAIQALVRSESLCSQNDELLFLRYLYILVFDNKHISVKWISTN